MDARQRRLSEASATAFVLLCCIPAGLTQELQPAQPIPLAVQNGYCECVLPTPRADSKYLLGYDLERGGAGAVWSLLDYGPSCGNAIDVGGCFAEHRVTEALNAPVMAPDSRSFAVDTDDGTHHSFSIEFFTTATGDLRTTRDVPVGVAGFATTNDRVAVVSLDGTVNVASSITSASM